MRQDWIPILTAILKIIGTSIKSNKLKTLIMKYWKYEVFKISLILNYTKWFEPLTGYDPITCCLQNSCSTNWATKANCNHFKVTNCPWLLVNNFSASGVSRIVFHLTFCPANFEVKLQTKQFFSYFINRKRTTAWESLRWL